MVMTKIRRNLSALTLLALASLVLSCAVNPVTGRKELMFMSEDQEKALGMQADPSIVAMYGQYEDARLQAFINEKGQQMGKISHRPNLKYDFKILDSPVVNAFAVPGGYVYFTRGILAHFNNEAEFAGVLGHEIGHITARHSASQQTRATLAQILFIGGLVVSPAFREFANEAQQGMQLLFLRYSRDNESQSDELGVEYSTKIGYDAREMANFFNTLNAMQQNAGGGSLPTFLATHPDPGDRFRNVRMLAEKAQAGQDQGKFQVNRDSYLRMIDGLIYGDDPRQGYVENSVFYHPVLRFRFPIPAGWQTVNTPSQVQMAPADGKSLMILTISDAKSLDEAASKLVEQHKLQVVERRNLTLNGMQVLAMVSDQTDSQNQQTIRILTYFIGYNGLIYTFHGLAERNDFDKYLANFNQTMRNFTVLNDQAKINKKPEVVRIRTANRQASLRDHLREARMPEARWNELALLNGQGLDQALAAGSLFKVIVTQ